jgi:hypothetical protein
MEEEKEIKVEKKLSAKEKRRRKRLSEKRQRGWERWCARSKKEREKKKEAERLKREKQKEREKKKREKLKAEKLEKEKRRKEKEREKKRKKKEAQKHKRKRGRPKKKPIVWRDKPFLYKILDTCNLKQCDYIGVYKSLEEAYTKIKELMKENSEIVFPVQIFHRDTVSVPVFEYLILERRGENKENPVMRNEFGKLVEQDTTSEKWMIRDKIKHEREETFWVWGYNNKVERKTFTWIFQNIILNGLDTQYDMKRVMLFKNKIVIKDDYGNIDLIFCKVMSDAIRFYNLVEEWVNKYKYKQILMAGSYNQKGEKREKLVKELMELTGWSKEKVIMGSTSKHLAK